MLRETAKEIFESAGTALTCCGPGSTKWTQVRESSLENGTVKDAVSAVYSFHCVGSPITCQHHNPRTYFHIRGESRRESTCTLFSEPCDVNTSSYLRPSTRFCHLFDRMKYQEKMHNDEDRGREQQGLPVRHRA